MSIPLPFGGKITNYPTTGDSGWGANATLFAQLISLYSFQKIADFSNANLSLRQSIQSITLNGSTGIPVVPNGTGTGADIEFYNNSTFTSAGLLKVGVSATAAYLDSNITSGGTQLPLQLLIAGSPKLSINSSGAYGIGATPSYGTAGQILTSGGSSAAPAWSSAIVNSIAGTANQIDVSASTGSVVISIDPAYPGQSSITTLGTIATGTWNATTIAPQHGGTGVANASTITIAGNVAFAGAFTFQGTLTGNTTVTFPTTGTLLTAASAVTSFTGGTTGLTPTTATVGVVTLAGTLNITNGGTGATSAIAGFNALSPMTTTGDLIYYAAGSATRLGIGSSGQALTVSGGIPSWASLAGTGTVTSVGFSTGAGISITGTNPITGSGTVTISNTGVTSAVAGTGIFVSAGTGAVTITNTGVTSAVAGSNISVSSATGAVTISVTGTVGSATNLAGGAAGDIVYQSAASTTAFLAAGSANQILQSNGASPPSWTGAPTISGANITSATIPNTSLAHNSVTVAAGTGLSGGGTVALGSTITINNAGVTSLGAGSGISVSASTGGVTITNTGVTSNGAGTGISVSASTGGVTITNTGVTNVSAGTGISVSASTGGVTITNTGPTTTSGTFTGTFGGFTTTITGTCVYDVVGNTATLSIPLDVLGTSNSTTYNMSGLPGAIIPATMSHFIGLAEGGLINSGGTVRCAVQITAGSGTITFWQSGSSSPGLTSAWLNSGTKGTGVSFSPGFLTFSYLLN